MDRERSARKGVLVNWWVYAHKARETLSRDVAIRGPRWTTDGVGLQVMAPHRLVYAHKAGDCRAREPRDSRRGEYRRFGASV